MVCAEIQSVECSIPHDGAAVLNWNGDDGRHWTKARTKDMPKSGPERDVVMAAWTLLSVGSTVIHAARLIPWWLFALVLLLVLAR